MKKTLKYKGKIYNRPCGRGLCILDYKNEIGSSIEELLSDGYWEAKMEFKFIGYELDEKDN